jgi:hypothetical protein
MEYFKIGDIVKVKETEKTHPLLEKLKKNKISFGKIIKNAGNSYLVEFTSKDKMEIINEQAVIDGESLELHENKVIRIEKSNVKTKSNVLNPKKKISIKISRIEGETHFKFEVDERITALYESMSAEIRTSEKWKDLRFYFVPSILENEEYKKLLNEYQLFDDFGKSVFDNNALNIAWLRTVGGNGEIILSDQISMASVMTATKRAVEFLKIYFDEYYKNYEVSGVVEFNI